MKKLVWIAIAVALVGGIAVFAVSQSRAPEPMDRVFSYDLPGDMENVYTFTWKDEGEIVVGQDYCSDDVGYITVGYFSYKGHDCMADPKQKIDVDGYIERLDGQKTLEAGGHTFYVGTTESDDMPDMACRAYVKHGDYVIEFSLTNFDDTVTEKQKKDFDAMLRSVRFLDE